MQLGDLAVQTDLDERVMLDPFDQVGRHRAGERLAPHDHRHPRASLGEAHDRLSRGVAGADHDDVVAAALRGLTAPGSVVDAAFEQLVDPASDSRRQTMPVAAITTFAVTV